MSLSLSVVSEHWSTASGTGFELPEIDVLMAELSPQEDDEPDPADAVPDVAEGPAVTQEGDVWLIGRHRLICGDSTKAETYERLLGEERAQMIFTDPPYNVRNRRKCKRSREDEASRVRYGFR